MDNYINPQLREEIQLKMNKMASNPSAYELRQKMVRDSLHKLGDVYSFWIEHPELRKAHLTHNLSEETVKKKAEYGIRCVNDGWYLLMQRGRDSGFLDVFGVHDLERLNANVERDGATKVAKFKPGERFRRNKGTYDNGSVNLDTFGTYVPPKAEHVPKFVQDLLWKVKDVASEDRLTAGIMAHLGLAAIQPFYDGNKRCARLVQNRILHEGGFPPSIIPAGEGKFYLDLFTKTLPAYAKGDLEGQRQFYDYNASKVNNALDTILDDLGVNPRDLDIAEGEKEIEPPAKYDNEPTLFQ